MKRFLPLFMLLPLAALLFACDTANSDEADALIVVEAFLYAGEPVSDFHLTETILLSSEDTLATPISDAEVLLIKGDIVYRLVPSDSAGYYHYPGDDLMVETGGVFRLDVTHEGRVVSAETVVPPPPLEVDLSGEVLEVEIIFGDPGGGGGGVGENALTVTWDNPAADLHYVVVESLVKGEPEYILPEFIRDMFEGFQLVTPPTDLSYFDIGIRQLEVYGPHLVVVYRVNEEYADLYENREQDSRDLNEPPTNVIGGLGVFSAFNSTSATFEVVPAE